MALIVNSQKRPFSKKPFNCFRDRYWGCADYILVILFLLSLVTVPEVFAKVNSAQSLLLSKVANLHDKRENELSLWYLNTP